MTSAYGFIGRTVLDRDSGQLGPQEIYDDQQTGQPGGTVASGFFGLKSHFVPLAGASLSG
jgi:hypothetical protein